MKAMKFWLLVSLLALAGEAAGEALEIGAPEAISPGETEVVPGLREKYSVMRPDAETRQEWQEISLTGPRAHIDPAIKAKRGLFSLLSYLQYTPNERDQGWCGDCWVWAGTGCLAIALNVQEGIKDRLSVQFLNSCYTTSYACCGGWAEYLANWYDSRGYCIPWSNTNASFQDWGRQCQDGSSLVSCASIGTATRYPINSCSVSYINTQGVSQATAIANIKNVLNQNKSIWFAFYAPTEAAGDRFVNAWSSQSENVYLSSFLDGDSCGQTWEDQTGWGHAVLCVGYDDTDPNNAVWIMLNSWGTTAKRPNGLFYVDMDINYSCQFYDPDPPSGWIYNYWWAAYDVDFSTATSSFRVLAGGDYNGDNYDDIAVFRPGSGLWSVRGITRVYFGSSADIPSPGDYDGDGTTDISTFRPASGVWATRGLTRAYLGSTSDLPVPGDYDGDGSCDMGLFRGSSGLWVIRGITRKYWGGSSDKPVPGDYAGEGTTDIGIFRNGLWAINGFERMYLGTSGDVPVPGDYPNWGWTNPNIFRPSSGLWAIWGYSRYYFGSASDQPVPADFNDYWGDDIAVFRDSSGLWAIRGYTRAYFGSSGDIPVTR